MELPKLRCNPKLGTMQPDNYESECLFRIRGCFKKVKPIGTLGFQAEVDLKDAEEASFVSWLDFCRRC